MLSSAFSPHRVNGGLLLSYLLELISLRIPWAAGLHLRSAARSVSRHLTESSPALQEHTGKWASHFDPFLSGYLRSGDFAGKNVGTPIGVALHRPISAKLTKKYDVPYN